MPSQLPALFANNSRGGSSFHWVWMVLGVVGCCWVPLDGVGWCMVLGVVGWCWVSLDGVGCHWMVLGAQIGCVADHSKYHHFPISTTTDSTGG